MNPSFRFRGVFLALAAGLITLQTAAAAPHIFWASDPVRPDETVLVQGSDLGGTSAVVEMSRLADAPAAAGSSAIEWTRVPILQGSDESLKFVIPAAWPMGIFSCRITAAGATSEPAVLNAPDTWWIQGDEGETASPGGWLRIFGKSLAIADRAVVRLAGEQAAARELHPAAGSDTYALRLEVPGDLAPGRYTVQVSNGAGGEAGWRAAGTLTIKPAPVPPAGVFSVLETYGPEALKQMRTTLVKYNQPLDRTEGIHAALEKARQNGGGIVYFPPGRYLVKGTLTIPEHTILRGEGEGLVTLWWGSGHFNLDGGGPQGRARVDEPKPPHVLIEGPDFALESLSLYLPIDYEQGIVADRRFRMNRVRVRIDHYWLVQGRGDGTVARLGRNFQVTECDILAKGDALVSGRYGVIAHNRISSNKSNTPLGGAQQVIVEDNQFVSMDPTAYQNISGTGRNIYYGHNRHEALYAQQSDYSFTFDAGAGAYTGAIAEAKGTQLTLASDPVYPQWAQEKSEVWRRSAVFILEGRGAGQWRDVVANHGRAWEIDRAFDVAPDASSMVSIVLFNGRVLIVGNHFEDANWVNAGYGTSIDVICAGNELFRCAELMNHGVHAEAGSHGLEPSWHVQYFDNLVAEGQTGVGSSGAGHDHEGWSGPLTCWSIHRRATIAADNGGSITIGGNLLDAIVEGCTLKNPASTIQAHENARGVLFRNNHFEGGPAPRYEGGGLKTAVVVPPLSP